MGKILDVLASMFYVGPKPFLKSPVNSNTQDTDFQIIKVPKSRIPFDIKPDDELIVLRIDPDTAKDLIKMSQYFETPYEGLIGRGLWLLSVFKEASLKSKRICVVEIEEESGQVLSVAPITLN